MLGAIIFERIPDRMLGRVTAPLDALAWAGMPFGGLVAAALVAGAGLGPALFVCAGVYVAAILVPALGNRTSFDPPTPPSGAADQDAVTTTASTGASTRETASR
jgi:hypothetical protein